jgi:hypothetical protein
VLTAPSSIRTKAANATLMFDVELLAVKCRKAGMTARHRAVMPEADGSDVPIA